MVKIILESAKFKKARSVKTIRAKSKRLLYANADKKKLIARLPITTTARYITNFQEASILSFRNMLYPTARAKASTTTYVQIT
jgi:hypothetical protein